VCHARRKQNGQDAAIHNTMPPVVPETLLSDKLTADGLSPSALAVAALAAAQDEQHARQNTGDTANAELAFIKLNNQALDSSILI
jgi:hypothetical protein